jgi:hypothetical protein
MEPLSFKTKLKLVLLGTGAIALSWGSAYGLLKYIKREASEDQYKTVLASPITQAEAIQAVAKDGKLSQDTAGVLIDKIKSVEEKSAKIAAAKVALNRYSSAMRLGDEPKAVASEIMPPRLPVYYKTPQGSVIVGEGSKNADGNGVVITVRPGQQQSK